MELLNERKENDELHYPRDLQKLDYIPHEYITKMKNPSVELEPFKFT